MVDSCLKINEINLWFTISRISVGAQCMIEATTPNGFLRLWDWSNKGEAVNVELSLGSPGIGLSGEFKIDQLDFIADDGEVLSQLRLVSTGAVQRWTVEERISNSPYPRIEIHEQMKSII